MFEHGSECVPTAMVVWIFLRSLCVICSDRHALSESHKNYFKYWCLMNLKPTFLFSIYLTQWIIAILSKGCKPDNFELHNSQKCSFMNIRGLHLNLIDCESFLESSCPNILALCQTNLDDSIDSGNFSVRGYLPLTWKDFTTHMHSTGIYVKEGLPFPRDLSLKNSTDYYLCINQLLCLYAHFFILLYLT